MTFDAPVGPVMSASILLGQEYHILEWIPYPVGYI